MSSFDPAAALAAGTTVVTPNNRLARTLIARHDAAMLRAGKRAWTAAHALPWSAWLGALWREAQEAGAAAAEQRLLAASEVRYLWDRIVREDASLPERIVDRRGASSLAEEAWELVHAWGAGSESWRGWRDTLLAPPESDVAAFVRWAERYHRELAQRSLLDAALLPDVLRTLASGVPDWRGQQVAFAGFLELSPQQERLRDALVAVGMDVIVAPPAGEPTRVLRARAETSRDEVRAALHWARRLVEEAPDRFVGIAIEDLTARRDEVRALAEDVLCPSLQLPGHANAPRPYGLSLGLPLSEHPMVAAALGLIALAHGPVTRAEAAALVRSPWWPESWSARARSELDWIKEGRTHVGWDDVAAALAVRAPEQAFRWRTIGKTSLPRTQSPRAWVTQWRDLLDRCGWPVEQDSQYETRQAWERLLEEFARIGHVEAQLTAQDALGLLQSMTARAIFQAEAPPAPIQILGLLEAAALPFDALWVAGLSARRWPPPAQPNPLLPVAWQRERQVPRSSAARELAYAKLLTRALMQGAPLVVLSAPDVVEDYESASSALVDASLPELGPLSLPLDSAQVVADARDMESVPDERAPALAPGPVRGGARLLASQSDCPFKAVAEHRLKVEPWPRAFAGLDYLERGILVHATLAAFWDRVRTHDALRALDPAGLLARIEAAVAGARGEIAPTRWRLLPAAVAGAESSRIVQIVGHWIDACELPRPAFEVTRIEDKTSVMLSGLTLQLKVDRVDTLPDGGIAILDYKAGEVGTPVQWFAPRPREPQLGIYALALRAEVPPADVRAVAYGQLKAGKIKVVGLAADTAGWPALDDAGKLKAVDGWRGVEQFWHERLPGLAAEVRDGLATVTPRNPRTVCRVCARQSLCRVGALGFVGDDDVEDGVDDE